MPLPIRDYVRRLKSYVPGEQPTDPKVVKLNTNENPYPPAPQVMKALANLGADAIRKYPPATADLLRDAIARRFGLEREWVVVGYGSDEALRLLCHALTGPGKLIVSLRPSYSLYPVLAEMYEAQTIFVDETPPKEGETAVLPEAFVQTATPLAFLANPNPPYGTFYPPSEIERMCEAVTDRVVVADEAYVDFAPASAIALIKDFKNLVITRTFSKSYSLAGMRVGFAIGAPELIDVMLTLKDSYNLPIASQVAALTAWEAREYHDETCRRIIRTRERMTAEMRKRGFTVPPSQGNFIFARHPRAAEFYRKLKERGVLVRYWDNPPLADGIRISVGTDAEMDRLFEEIDKI